MPPSTIGGINRLPLGGVISPEAGTQARPRQLTKEEHDDRSTD